MQKHCEVNRKWNSQQEQTEKGAQTQVREAQTILIIASKLESLMSASPSILGYYQAICQSKVRDTPMPTILNTKSTFFTIG